jgi:hypothetical protein
VCRLLVVVDELPIPFLLFSSLLLLPQVTALITNLTAGETVGYKVGSDRFGWSTDYHFKVPHPPGEGELVRIAAFGDLGTYSDDGSHQVRFDHSLVLIGIHKWG